MLDINNGRDYLTHLFVRPYLPTLVHHETECSITRSVRYVIMYLDIDRFKTFNDKYGHDNGDVILQQFAIQLSYAIRTSDYAFRYGGEAFLVVLADITDEQLPIISEKIRSVIKNVEFKLSDDTTIKLTASIGVALHDCHPDYQQIIANADIALYKAKKNDRNRVEINAV